MANTRPQATRAAQLAEQSSATQSLLLVAGSGRSGTSAFSGILQRLGYHVPRPEIPVDESNPRGFAESQWVVDFHNELLKRARVQVSDARPGAWADVARVSLDAKVRRQLRSWLEEQFDQSDHVLIKDPRLSWFLALWRRCGEELNAAPRFATMLRHPAAVVRSKNQWYGERTTDASRAAGWLNQALYTERATRGAPRVFLHYRDLLEDWAKAIERVGRVLDLSVVRSARATSMAAAAQLVDPALSRTNETWDSLAVSPKLRERSDEAWTLLSRLAEGHEGPELEAELDEARSKYIAFYEQAEAVAQSSIWAARPRASQDPPRSTIVNAIPAGIRHRIPLNVRKALLPLLSRRSGR